MGFLGTDVRSTLEVQIDVANRKLFLKKEGMTRFPPVRSEPTRCEVRILKFGRVCSSSSALVEPEHARNHHLEKYTL